MNDEQKQAPFPISLFAEWLANGERGISSNAIVAQLTGHPTDRRPASRGNDHPYDPADFSRCEQLLEKYPFARSQMYRMRDRSKQWAALVDHWEEIRTSLVTERRERTDRIRPATYDLMKRILDKAVA